MVLTFAFRNIKKSISDYTIYFVTLILGVSLFYVYQAMLDQRVTEWLMSLDYDKIALLSGVFRIATVMVTVILAFLIMYASSFFMRRKRKEFAIYMLLGMKKRTIAGVLIMENLVVGAFSLLVGLLSGFVLSQGVSIAVIHMFEADMSSFSFEVSAKATIETILCFVIIYVLVMIWDLIVVGKAKLITLLNAERRMEKNVVRNPALCTIVFLLAAVALGHTYYRAIFEQEFFGTELDLILECGKGIISTYLIFWSLSGLLVFVAKLRKKSYLCGLRIVTIKELTRRINTNSFAMGSICVLLFASICIFSVCLSINHSLNNEVEKRMPVDVNLVKWIQAEYDLEEDAEENAEKNAKQIRTIIEEKGIDGRIFSNEVEVMLYDYYVEDVDPEDTFLCGESVMSVSDYNKVATLYGLQTITLQENQYAVVCDDTARKRAYHRELEAGRKIELSGYELQPVQNKCYDGYLEMAATYSNLGFFVVPDKAMEDDSRLYFGIRYYLANFKQGKTVDLRTYFHEKNDECVGEDGCYLLTKDSVRQQAVNYAGMIAFVGIYIGIICILASVALLSLKEMSQAVDNRGKYDIMKKLGVDSGMIHKSILVQGAAFFISPLVLAISHSMCGIYVSMHIMEQFGFSGMLTGIVSAAIVILVIYLIYFALVYRFTCRIVDEK